MAAAKKQQQWSRRTAMLLENEPAQIETHLDTMRVIFRRALAAILGSRGVHCDSESFDFLALLAEEYMTDVFSRLHRTCTIQRRVQPAVRDLAEVMKHEHIQIVDLEKQLNLQSKFTDALANLRFDATEEPISDDAKAFFVSETNQRGLVPPKRKRAAHIPSWLPTLPADHTYKSTPQYTERITDPRQLRERIVEEGRLAEEALRRLAGTLQVDAGQEEEEDEDEDEDEQEAKSRGGIKFDDSADEAHAMDVDIKSELDSESDGEGAMRLPDEAPKRLDVFSDSSAATGPISLASLSTARSLEPETPLEKEPIPQPPPTAPPIMESNPVAVEEVKPKPKGIKLRLSLGGSKAVKVEETLSKPANGADHSLTDNKAPHVHDSSRTDLFELRNSTSANLDILSFIRKRKEIVATREKRQAERRIQLEQQANQPRYPCQDIVDREYNAAFASIQRNRDKKGDTNSILDTGVVNWDRERYV